MLFGLQKSGFWFANNKEWHSVGAAGYAMLSEVHKLPISEVLVLPRVYEVEWGDHAASMKWTNQRFPKPVVVFEEC